MRQLVNGAEVTVADFSYTSLMQAPESIEILAQVIERSQSLLTLLLSGNGVTDAGATAILSALRSNKTVVHVDLSYNKLSAAVVEDIMFLLDHNESIERIYLQGNLPEGEGELITPAKEARVWARLSKNHMPDNGTCCSSSLHRMPVLTHLFDRQNQQRLPSRTRARPAPPSTQTPSASRNSFSTPPTFRSSST